jgi:hypothetical protein
MSRAFEFQPYFERGFSAWSRSMDLDGGRRLSAMALMPVAELPKTIVR